MGTHTARFLGAGTDAQRLPAWPHLEVAFAGRSNVGKSSLLNRLVGQRGLARVSRTPGRTRQINFFLVDEALVFADLPGYGFARVPLAVRAAWKDLVEGYLAGRATLRLVVVLVDIRRGLEADDRLLLDYLAAQGCPALVVATKTDTLARHERQRRVRELARAVGERCPVLACSARTGEGIPALWAALRRGVAAPP